jgi:hypothetical protein
LGRIVTSPRFRSEVGRSYVFYVNSLEYIMPEIIPEPRPRGSTPLGCET